MKKIILISSALSVFFLLPQAANARPGELDPSFGRGGRVVSSVRDREEIVEQVALQPDGKIVVVGTTKSTSNDERPQKIFLARYLENGNPDPECNGDGWREFGEGLKSRNPLLSVSSGNTILVAFETLQYRRQIWGLHGDDSDIILMKFDRNCEPASDFGGRDGKVTFQFYPPNVDHGETIKEWSQDGEIRMGQYEDTIRSLALQRDGKILIGARLLRYSIDDDPRTRAPDSALDSCLAAGEPGCREALAQRVDEFRERYPGERIYYIARFLPNGRPDTSFGSWSGSWLEASERGRERLDHPADEIGVQNDGKLVFLDKNTDFPRSTPTLTRLHNNGRVDMNFGGSLARSDGSVPAIPFNRVSDMAIRDDDAIVVAGFNNRPLDLFGRDFRVVLFRSDGTLDSNFGFLGVTAVDPGGLTLVGGVALEDFTNRIIVCGSSYDTAHRPRLEGGRGREAMSWGVARFNPDGRPDMSFGGPEISPISDEGTLYTNIGCPFFNRPEEARMCELDTAEFYPSHCQNGDRGANDYVTDQYDKAFDCVVQPDGKIIVAGWRQVCSSFGNETTKHLAIARYKGHSAIPHTIERDTRPAGSRQVPADELIHQKKEKQKGK